MDMIRVALGFFVLVLSFCVGSAAMAHHPPRMDKCASFSFSGEIAQIEWRPPHVELQVRADDGTEYHVSWLAINQLRLAGIDENTLKAGDRVEITAGIRPNDVVARPMLLSYIHRDSDGWGWSQVPQGC
jgi:hypothetical protein